MRSRFSLALAWMRPSSASESGTCCAVKAAAHSRVNGTQRHIGISLYSRNASLARMNWDTIPLMRRYWNLVLCAALALPCGAQPRTRQNLASILGFENGQAGVFPAGWGGSPVDTIFVDDQVFHSGRYA